MKRILIAGVASLMASAVAYSADAVIEDVPVAVEVDGFTWSGFYVGANAGYGWADVITRRL